MNRAVFRICPACEEPTRGAIVDRITRSLLCDLCGERTGIELLPPLLFVTGASGAGKTTLYQALVGEVDEALLIDADLLWGADPAHDDPASGYRQFRGLVLHLAERLAKNGKPVVVEGSCIPDQYENLGERWYFSKTAYLAVVCSDEELERRLRARPQWRGSTGSVEAMVTWNRSLRETAPASDPRIDLLDTTDRTVEDCAAELHEWIRREVITSADSTTRSSVIEFLPATAVRREQLLGLRQGFDAAACTRRLRNMEAGRSDWIVAVAGDNPQGWLVIEWTGKKARPHHPDIADVFVRGDARGAGVGTALITEAERRVRERGHTEVGLSVNPTENPDARRLYERLGYRHDGGTPYLDGIYDGREDWVIDMVKPLSSRDRRP